MFHIFGCPMHVGVGVKGLIHSLNYLNDYCKDFDISIFPEVILPEENLPNLKNLNSVVATCEKIAAETRKVFENGETPLFIAGDHSSALGTVSAASSYFADEVGLIWVDAHPDINTDKTTVTGNIHGMPVAALLGMGEPSLTRVASDKVKIKPENVVMLGLRDIDPPERETLREQGIMYFTYETIAQRGIHACLEESIAHLKHLKHVHISFDIDVMDPQLIPGVSVPVPSGFHEGEAFYVINELMEHLPVCSCDIVEYNAELDHEDKTARFAQDLANLILSHGK